VADLVRNGVVVVKEKRWPTLLRNTQLTSRLIMSLFTKNPESERNRKAT